MTKPIIRFLHKSPLVYPKDVSLFVKVEFQPPTTGRWLVKVVSEERPFQNGQHELHMEINCRQATELVLCEFLVQLDMKATKKAVQLSAFCTDTEGLDATSEPIEIVTEKEVAEEL